jgi:hypothetical protein
MEEAEGWYRAFCYLSASRPSGFAGAMPIPLTEIDAYCRLANIPVESRMRFMRMMRRLDSDYLDAAEKRKTITIEQPKTETHG